MGEFQREIGRTIGQTPGPAVMFVAGQHGNEPAGIVAFERVFREIEEDQIPVRGEIAGFAGNLRALAENRRYIECDLNRHWAAANVARVLGSSEDRFSEDRELRELVEAFDGVASRAAGPVYLLDLHTASASSAPFVILNDTIRNRRFARRFPTPVVLGVEDEVVGTLAEHTTRRGWISIAVETGAHEDPQAIDHHEAIVWHALVFAGAVAADRIPGFDRHRRALVDACEGIPGVVEVFHRHGIAAADEFVMSPGFRNFDRVDRNQELALDRSGPIRSPGDYHVFMPLYQGTGDDGFFLARPVNTRWLSVSTVMRRLRLPSIVPWLPGVARHSEREDLFVVDPRIARFFRREIFHLLGYRVRTEVDGRVVVQLRPE